jgi:hypothetical protein
MPCATPPSSTSFIGVWCHVLRGHCCALKDGLSRQALSGARQAGHERTCDDTSLLQAEVPVNWCPALGTVLANEEVIDGKSERGGHPVVRMPMKQWMLRITAYADRWVSRSLICVWTGVTCAVCLVPATACMLASVCLVHGEYHPPCTRHAPPSHASDTLVQNLLETPSVYNHPLYL